MTYAPKAARRTPVWKHIKIDHVGIDAKLLQGESEHQANIIVGFPGGTVRTCGIARLHPSDGFDRRTGRHDPALQRVSGSELSRTWKEHRITAQTTSISPLADYWTSARPSPGRAFVQPHHHVVPHGRISHYALGYDPAWPSSKVMLMLRGRPKSRMERLVRHLPAPLCLGKDAAPSSSSWPPPNRYQASYM